MNRPIFSENEPLSRPAPAVPLAAHDRIPSADPGDDTAGVLEFADVRIDLASRTASVQNIRLDLSPNEFSVLACLMRNPQRALPREELLDRIWGFETAIETRVADDTIKRLRRKISGTRLVVETVWGYGFRLRAKL
ncbi:MAG: response regulator transcription factor [Clostridia bacterium]|nr:response regulator transcription factor [Clostridia bacterium]